MIELTCPSCSRILHIPDNLAGYKAICKRCNTEVQIPARNKADKVPDSKAYACPHCGDSVQRGSDATRTAAGFAAGLVGMLTYNALGGFHCRNCGPIAKSEFPADVQRQMTRGSLAWTGIAAVAIAVVILGISALILLR